ncbi:hypothetical protein WR25_13797 [Diploscapter pachys]|uniref:receptor protein-tyrosine kinase n=1 Tax=Diploscapter pachys TaxID=2018661 RepID=A0A2A2JHR1_9BILA|nr:hypothetical protein WR25_13797 [Diploscapter pachys]
MHFQESDTGTYKCHTIDDESLEDHVHVFVYDSKPFVPLKPGLFSASEDDILVRCVTTKFVKKQNVNLKINGEMFKDAHKYYLQTEGFKISGKALDLKLDGLTNFECVYLNDPEQPSKINIEITQPLAKSNFQVSWNESSEWPHVGMNFSISCMVEAVQGRMVPYLHQLNITCPRCANDEVAHSSKRHDDHRRTLTMNIESLTTEDSGVYNCTWTKEGSKPETFFKTIEVSPKVAQIRVIERGKPEILVEEGESMELKANVLIYPLDGTGYSSKWIRRYTTPIRESEQTEILLTDQSQKTIVSEKTDGRVKEKLDVQGMTLNMSGIYVLVMTHKDEIRSVEWKVEVKSRKAQPNIFVRGVDSFVLFEQKYYKPGTSLSIDCIVAALPLAEVKFEKKNPGGNWQEIGEIVLVSGTFERGLTWQTVADRTMQLRCTGTDQNGKSNSMPRTIRVSENAPRATTRITKSEKATQREDPKEIYEGDDITLDCNFPKNDDWDTTWVFGSSRKSIPAIEESQTYSKHLIATLTNVSSADAGEYICVLKNDTRVEEVKQIISITKITRPFHTKTDPDEPQILQWGEPTTFNCNISGTPNPDIIWYKDKSVYTHGQLSNNNQTLHIPRVLKTEAGEFTCEGRNRAGSADYKFETKVDGAEESSFSSGQMVLFAVIILVLLAILCCCFCAFLKQRRKAKEQERALGILYEQLMRTQEGPLMDAKMPKLPLDQRLHQLPYNKNFELDRKCLEVGHRIGCGQFGKVNEGMLTKARVTDEAATKRRLHVAVKSPLVGTNVTHQKMLADELKIMCAIGKHPNVVTLIGAITKNMKGGELYVVVEMCELGNLKEFLQANQNNFINELKLLPPETANGETKDGYLRPTGNKQRSQYAFQQDPQWAISMETDRLLPDGKQKNEKLATSDLISFAMQISNGMEYLAMIPCIHRDLAARNILLTSNRICRIADFGLAKNTEKNYYRMTKNPDLPQPFRWMSIEAIRKRIFTQEVNQFWNI